MPRAGDEARPAGRWRPVATADGSWTLGHGGHGETCHSRSGAALQARERYAGGAALAERAAALRARGATSLALLDVGSGLGLNLAAALEAVERAGLALDALSLELDPGVLRATLELARERPGLAGALEPCHARVRAAFARALDDPAAGERGLDLAPGRLRLWIGDARERIAALDAGERFDAVFLDGFSPRVDASLWEPAFLARVARAIAPGGRLATYSAAVPVRVALLSAGLRVGRLGRVGPKAEGTVAGPDLDPAPLPPRLARRLARRAGEAAGRASAPRASREQGPPERRSDAEKERAAWASERPVF